MIVTAGAWGARAPVYVVRGTGTARIGDQRVPVREGDYLAFPVGPEHAHQMINNGNEPLVYLCISASAQKVDVVGYPDSKKLAATAGTFEKPIHRWISRQGEPRLLGRRARRRLSGSSAIHQVAAPGAGAAA